MSDIPLKPVGSTPGAGVSPETKSLTNEKGGNFGSVIQEALNKVSQVQDNVDTAVNDLAAGGDITSAVLAVEKADMSFQLMVEVRNKLISTYQEIMRMQV